MSRTLGALAGLAFLGMLFVGPAYLAVAAASASAPRCVAEPGCEPRPQITELR